MNNQEFLSIADRLREVQRGLEVAASVLRHHNLARYVPTQALAAMAQVDPDAVGKRITELEAALRDVMGDDELGVCSRVHHEPNDRHSALESCPVVRRYTDLAKLEEKDGTP